MAYAPRFQSPQSQRRAVTAAMIAVLLLSVALAQATVGLTRSTPAAGPGPQSPPRLEELTAGELKIQFNIPASWQAVGWPDAPAGLSGASFFADPARPTRVLAVIKVAAEGSPGPAEVLEGLLPSMMPPEHAETLGPVHPSIQTRGSSLHLMDYIGLSRGPDGYRTHAAVVLTFDRQRYWLLYLTDEPASEAEDPRTLAVANGQALRQIYRTTSVATR